jgi:protein-L-isoaspartate(D-aspartate) O-methyltransferase
MIEYYNYDSAKTQLINTLKEKGIFVDRVLNAIQKVDRHKFVQAPFLSRAYEDTSLPIGANQTISQPYTVAVMTECLRIKDGSKILEIGTGSGYQAAILSEMGAIVYSVERIPELLNEAEILFKKFNYNITCKIDDGTLGWQEHAPFDGIIVTAAAPEVPKILLEQLSENGVLVAPVGSIDVQDIYVITKRKGNIFTEIKKGFRFVPLIGKEGWS